MDDAQFVGIKSLSMGSTGSANHRDIFLRVGKHNFREIVDERHDPCRKPLNRILHGPDNAADMNELAWQIIKRESMKSVRQNGAIGIEIVFALPAHSAIDRDAYFADALRWTCDYYKLPMISAVIHHDEDHPHMHVVMVAVRNGKIGASAILGGRSDCKAMHVSFNELVGKGYGLRLRQKPFTGSQMRRMGYAIADELKSHPSRLKEPLVYQAMVQAVSQNPVALMHELGLEIPQLNRPKVRSSVDIFIRNVKPDDDYLRQFKNS